MRKISIKKKALFGSGLGLLFIVACIVIVSASKQNVQKPGIDENISKKIAASFEPGSSTKQWASGTQQEIIQALQHLAETERVQGFSPGMGLAESSLYEKAGDLAGAVLGAFKELFFAYQYGVLSEQDLSDRLKAVAKQFPDNKLVLQSLEACRALITGNAGAGRQALSVVNLDNYEIDAFPRWMERVFLLTTGNHEAQVLDTYLATRSRYANYPLYWLVIARKSSGSQKLDAAERTVSLAPHGPYATEGRSLMAEAVGLSKKESSALRTRHEIETITEKALQSGSGELLKDLFSLLALPDNPYSLYALGVFRGLVAEGSFVTFFEQEQKKASGRLAERLRYITGSRS
jgi:hypothetical protein